MNDASQNLEGGLLGSLDEPLQAKNLASAASYSPSQFYRIAKRALNDKPMQVRRRLLLERAAYQLTHSTRSVTEIAFDANFESLEGFTRAFRRCFGLSPSAYRKLSPAEFWIDLSERIHFAPSERVGRGQGETNMNIVERMVEHHCWSLGRMLDACETLPPERLDQEMVAPEPFPWLDRKMTLRQALGRAVAFAAPWMEAINGVKSPYDYEELPKMREAIAVNRKGFFDIYRAVERDGSWDLTFVDAVCDPPEVFTYGGVLGHMLTFNAYRQVAIIFELQSLGFKDIGSGDPIEYDRAQ